MDQVQVRKMKLADFFRLGKKIREYYGEDFAGDSVFIRKDRSFQGLINHCYQKLCLFTSLAFGRSPIDYKVSLASVNGEIVAVCWHRGSDKRVGIFVNSKYRKMGIGYKVASKLCEIVKDEMKIIYDDYNHGLKIFSKLGFEKKSTIIEMVRNKQL